MAILVNHERLDPIVTSQATTQVVNDNTLVSEAEINSEAELLKSSDVLRQVVVVNGLEGQPRHSLLGSVSSQAERFGPGRNGGTGTGERSEG